MQDPVSPVSSTAPSPALPVGVTVDGLGDPVPLARALIGRPSITPEDAGALDVLQAALEALGFRCWRLPFDSDDSPRVDNLYARLGTAGPVFGYAGHTDVVPAGAGWAEDPFAGSVADGMLHGRGAADMKGGIACFVAAVARVLEARKGAPLTGSIAFLITGDEEGPAVNGTRKVLAWMEAEGQRMDHCLVGEPTNPDAMGDMLKVGRRGSVNMVLTIHGKQGHVAYPHLADNPIHRLVRVLDTLTGHPLDPGTEHFQPSSLQVTSIDVGNPATNVIPGTATARLNIRFNNLHDSAKLESWVRGEALSACDGDTAGFTLESACSGEAFLTPPGRLSDLIVAACAAVTGRQPELSTSGGTSDARFIKDHCPVAEFGLVGKTMHKANEQVALTDMEALTAIYERILTGYFEAP